MRSWSPQIRVGSSVPMREGSTDTVFHSRVEHIPVELPPAIQVAEQVEAKSVDSLEAEAKDPGNAMVVI